MIEALAWICSPAEAYPWGHGLVEVMLAGTPRRNNQPREGHQRPGRERGAAAAAVEAKGA